MPRFFLKERQLGPASEMLGWDGAKLNCTVSQASARGDEAKSECRVRAVSARRGPGRLPSVAH